LVNSKLRSNIRLLQRSTLHQLPTESNMNKEEVGRWIAEEVGLPEYRATFEENDITYAELINLHVGDLRDMNISKVGHRKRIEMAILALRRRPQPPFKRKNEWAGSDAKRTKLDTFLPSTAPDSSMDLADDLKSLLLTGVPGKCCICQEDKDNIFHLHNCTGEAACIECLQEYFKHEVERKVIPITCHDKLCRHEISPSDLDVLLKRAEMEKFHRAGLESLVAPLGVNNLGKKTKSNNSVSFLHCPTANCPYIFTIDKNSLHDDESYHLRCEVCREHYCLKCRVKYHKNQSCMAYRKERLQVGGEDELLLLAYLQSRKVKACPQCKRYVERTSGCSHMNCLCGCSFCYLCGSIKCACKPGTVDADYIDSDEDVADEYDEDLY
jgi:E3 ubiquitin-protein ligase RNF144